MDTSFSAGELIFIDTGISNYQSLIPEIAPDNQVFFLDSTQDGVQQINDVLDDYTNISEVHIFSHGAEGSLQLGNTTLNQSTLAQYADELTAWSNSLTIDADILFYGCNVASGNGGDFLLDIAQLTETDIAASEDLTGNIVLNGDWDLEYQAGAIEAQVLSSQSFNSVLATLSGSISGTQTFTEDVTVDGNITLDGDVTLDLNDSNFTLGSSFTISGNNDGSADNLTIINASRVTIEGDIGGNDLNDLSITVGSSSGITVVNEIPSASFATTAITIQGQNNDKVDISVDGKISLTAEDKDTRIGISPFNFASRQVSIGIENATLNATEIGVNANAEDKTVGDQVPSWVNKLGVQPAVQVPSYLIGSLTIPAAVQMRGSDADVTVNNSTITASGNVDITSTATVNSSVNAITSANSLNPFSRVAIAYGQGSGDAQTQIQGTTSISGADVTIKSTATNTTKAFARVFGNVNQTFEAANAKEKGGSLAISNTTTVSKASVGSGTSINATGNVNIDAIGDVTSEAKATTAIFLDGTVAVGFGLNFDDTDIKTDVNGTITAGGSSSVGTTVDLNNVDKDNNTITIDNHGFSTGDQVIYSNGSGTSIDGLTDGDTYNVLVIDSNTIKLTKDTAIDIDNTGLNSNIEHGLTAQGGAFFDAATDINVDTDEFTIANHGFTTGQQVVYTADDGGEELDLLTSQGAYYVIVTGDNTFKLAATIERAAEGTADVDLIESDKSTGSQHIFNYVDYDQVQKTFDASDSGIVDTTNSQITIANHGLGTGEIVNYSPGTGTVIGGLSERGYFAVVIDENTIKLAESYDEAIEGTTLTFSSLGASTHEFTYTSRTNLFDPTSSVVNSENNTINITGIGTKFETGDAIFYEVDPSFSTTQALPVNLSFDPSTDVDLDSNTITIETLHGLETGDEVTYEIGFLGETATEIGNLTKDTVYYAIKISDTELKLATTKAEAEAYSDTNDTSINLDTGAAGTLHNLSTSRDVTVYDTPLENLENSTYYHVVVIDDDTIQLVESFADTDNVQPIAIDGSVATGSAHTLSTPGTGSGISITTNLTASDKAQSKGSNGSNPKIRDLLANPDLLPLTTSIFQPSKTKDLLKGKDGSSYGKIEGKSGVSFGLSLAYNAFDHDVITTVGSSAILKSSGDITVDSQVTQKVQTVVDSATGKDSAGLAMATSFALGFYENTVQSLVYDGATLDASGNLAVTSNLTYPFLIDLPGLFSGTGDFDFSNSPLDAYGNLGILTSDFLLGGKLGFNKLFNTFATTKNKGKKNTQLDVDKSIADNPNDASKHKTKGEISGTFGLALSGAYNEYTNTSEAIIGYRDSSDTTVDGVLINQDSNYQTDTQSVLVDANTKIISLNASGIIHFDLSLDVGWKAFKKGDATEAFNIFGNRAKNGLGVSMMAETMNNTTTAKIRDGVQIHTGALAVDADPDKKKALAVKATENIFSLEIAQGGGDAETFGFTGSGIYLGQTSNTIAQVESGATITGGSMLVDADSNNTRVNVVGAVQQTDSIGIWSLD